MARPLRLEYSGALYHVTSRGDRREDIYIDDDDRSGFLSLLGEVCRRFHWRVYAYCLMSNHYHILLETREGNLSRGMRHLNGIYTQRFNRRHQRVGHVFQGRYKAILVQKDSHLLELARYVVLNPVRADMAADAGAWPWSSYRATALEGNVPDWLDRDGLLANFGRRRASAAKAYAQFVDEGIYEPSPWHGLSHQIFLGDDAFISAFRAEKPQVDLTEIPKTERQPLVKSLMQYQLDYPKRDEAMAQAYDSGAYTMKEIAAFFSVHYMTVSRAVRKYQNVGM